MLEKSPAELTELPDAALSLLSIGPESGDDRVLQRNTRADHVEVVRRAHEADLCR